MRLAAAAKAVATTESATAEAASAKAVAATEAAAAEAAKPRAEDIIKDDMVIPPSQAFNSMADKLERLMKETTAKPAAEAPKSTAPDASDKVQTDSRKPAPKAEAKTEVKTDDATTITSPKAADWKIVKEAKAKAEAEAAYANTPKARESARVAHAQASYDVAIEKCDDLAGNTKDVCVKEAKAALVLYEVDELGLDRLDRAILLLLTERFKGKPVGLSTLAVAVGEQLVKDEIRRHGGQIGKSTRLNSSH